MAKYLDNLGLTYLWSKIKGFFLSKVAFNTSRKGENLYAKVNEVSGYINGSGTITPPSATAKEVTSDWIPVAGASTFTVQTWLNESRSMWLAYMFYSDKDLSTKIGSRPSKSANATYLSYDNVSIPTEANYVRVSYRTHGIGRCKVEIDGKTAWSKSLPDIQDYDDRLQYNNLVWVNAALAAKSLAANRTGMGYEPLVTGYSYDIAFPILYAPNAVDASTEWSGGYLAYPNISMASLGINVETMQYGQVLWLKGTLNGVAFTLAPEPFVTMVKPTSEDGYLYMPIGWTKDENTFWFQQTHQFYAFTNGAFGPIETVSGGGGSIATPVSVANGGTGADNAADALDNLGVTSLVNTATNGILTQLSPQIQGVVLFNRPNYEPSWGVDLSDDFTNYDFLKIVCKDNDGGYVQPVIIPNPQNGDQFNVTSIFPAGGTAWFYLKSTQFLLQNDNEIRWPMNGNNYMCGEIGLNAPSTITWTYTFRHTPVLVIGYKYV